MKKSGNFSNNHSSLRGATTSTICAALHIGVACRGGKADPLTKLAARGHSPVQVVRDDRMFDIPLRSSMEQLHFHVLHASSRLVFLFLQQVTPQEFLVTAND
ncbi:hypothetical protein C0J52_16806 [Blattella germanica]|nr:hypothetical protein C0J52_16806 [Blattella germanica]